MGSIPQLSIIKGLQQEAITKSLPKIFEENLQQYPQKVALIYTDLVTHMTSQITYNDMNRKANQYAKFMAEEAKRNRLTPNNDGDYIIAVCMKPSSELVAALMSIWKAGAAYLPIDPSFPQTRVQHILKEAQPIMVLHDDDIDPQRFGSTPTLSIEVLNRLACTKNGSNLMESERLNGGNKEIAIVLYTSGSTGVPKGVRLPHEVIMNRLNWQWKTFPYSPKETVGVFKTALTFVDSISELWGPLLCGLAILVVPKEITKDPERLVSLLEEYKIRRLVLVPTLLRSLLLYLGMTNQNRYTQKTLYNLEIWVCSGEPLAVSLAQSFFDYFEEGVHSLFNFYGSTEIMGDVTYFKCESKKQLASLDRVPIGIPVFNTVIYLLDSDFKPVKNGEIGEIYVSGANLASGYVNGRDPQKFLDNPLAIECKYSRIYQTGDFGSVADGFIMYEGRTDSQIKIRGHRVDLSEVEKNISDLTMVEKTIVLCYHAGQVDQALLAFVKLRDDSPLISEMQLELKLQDKLSDYMIPQIVLIDSVPLLVNGKVDRQALLKLYETANNNEGDCSIVLDYDYMEVPEHCRAAAQVLFEAVGNVIGRSTRSVTIGPYCNFYELGGNSLNSIFTISMLRDKGYNIGISDFITAKNLAEVIDRMVCKQGKGSFQIGRENDWIKACPHLDMETVPLHMSHKSDVIKIIVDSFYGKADLEQWLKPDIFETDYRDIINDIWLTLIEKDLSFVIRDRNTNKIIGTALNFDARDEPEIEVKSKLIIVLEFLEYLEAPLKDNYLPQGLNKILHSFMMGTSSMLDARENIACMQLMEHEVLNMAKKKHFVGILTTNTSPLTQQLGSDVYNYETLLDYQVNQYVYKDGTKPFAKAPDSQRCLVHYKEVS